MTAHSGFFAQGSPGPVATDLEMSQGGPFNGTMTEPGGTNRRRLGRLSLAGTALITSLTGIALSSGTAGAATGCLSLPVAFNYGEYTGGAASLSAENVLGNGAYGGSVSVKATSTVASASGPAPATDTLVAGGPIDVQIGTLNVPNGSVISGAAVVGSVDVTSGTISQNQTTLPVAFPTVTPTVTSTAGNIAAFTATGSPGISGTTIAFAGTGTGTSIFSIPATTLGTATAVDITDTAGGTVIINVTGTAAIALSGITVNVSGISGATVLWNLAAPLTLATSTWQGTILDTKAVTLTSNTVTGSVISSAAGTFTGDTVNQALFSGCASNGPGTGTPEAPLTLLLPLAAVAVGGGYLVVRRRRQGTSTGVPA
jgi:hypothetical protein